MSRSQAPARRKAAAPAKTTARGRTNSLYIWGGAAALGTAALLGGLILFNQVSGPPTLTSQQLADPAFVGPDLHSLVIDPKSPDHVFAGGHASAVVSTDGGKTLKQVNGLQNVDAMNWAVSPDGIQQVVAGHYGVRASSDGGSSWTDLTSHLPRSDVHSLGMDPSNPAHLFAYVVGAGVYASTDGGQTWVAKGGQDLSMMGPMVLTPGATSLLAVDMQSGLMRSTDDGKSWATVGSGLIVGSLAVDPRDTLHLLAVGTGLEQSHDGGATWSSGGNVPSGTRAVAIGPGPGAPWYAGLMLNQHAVIFRSTDSGASWQVVTAST